MHEHDEAAAYHEAMESQAEAEYEAGLAAEAGAAEAAVDKPTLAALRSDYDARQQHAADVTQRMRDAEALLEEKLAQIRKKWAESFSELIAEEFGFFQGIEKMLVDESYVRMRRQITN